MNYFKKTSLISSAALLIFFNISLYAEVRVSAIADRPIVVVGQDQNIVVKVGLIADKDKKTKRMPINLAVVLDKSGSMGSNQKMENAKLAALDVIQRLDEEDIFSLVIYDDEPRILIPAQRVKNKDYLAGLVRNVYSGGSTALWGGVNFGAAEVRKNLSDQYINRIILLSDGLANVGPQSTEELSELGRRLSHEGITVSTVGVGLDYNEDLMAGLAKGSDGNFYFAKNSDSLPEIFSQEIGEAMTLQAKDIKIHLECLGEARPVSVIGRKGSITEKSFELGIKDLYSNSEKFALFEMSLPKGKDGQVIKAASISIEYTDPYSRKAYKDTKEVTIKYTGNIEMADQQLNKDVVKDVALNRVSVQNEQAVQLSKQGKYKEASKLFEKGKRELEKSAAVCDNDSELLGAAKDAGSLAASLIRNKSLSSFEYKATKSRSYGITNQQRAW
ncbi:MAG: VWA domain-containing protein [Candidatus Omnitrophica bacterium]|nr:VWA domain-containing protein [Candidatus Omnitrophota bacterium]